LVFLHNGLYELPETFRDGNASGLRQISTSLVTVTDIANWNGQLAFSLQQTSVHGIPNLIPGQPHSNLQFLRRADLAKWGPAEARGGVWLEDTVKAAEPSDAILIGGYQRRCLHLVNHGKDPLDIKIEINTRGDDRWAPLSSYTLTPGSYLPVILPTPLAAEWLRVKTDQDGMATAFLHVSTPRTGSKDETEIFNGLSRYPKTQSSVKGIVRAGFPSGNLQFLRDDGRYFEIDQTLTPHAVDAPASIQKLQETHVIEPGFTRTQPRWFSPVTTERNSGSQRRPLNPASRPPPVVSGNASRNATWRTTKARSTRFHAVWVTCPISSV
jgi:hypothetical protein